MRLVCLEYVGCYIAVVVLGMVVTTAVVMTAEATEAGATKAERFYLAIWVLEFLVW